MDTPQDDLNLKMPLSSDLARRVEEATGQNVFLCYQCVRCTNGCPVSEFFDWQPNQIMRAVQLGQEDIALHAETPWLCVACQTCSTRCPQGLDITAVMEFLTRETLDRGIEPALPKVDAFNRAFMREVRWWGRAYEPGLMAEMTLRHPDLDGLRADLPLYISMLRKGKVPVLPKPGRIPRAPGRQPEAAGALAFYPGCSLHAMAEEYRLSAEAVCEALTLPILEPEGWVCCGSSAAHRIDPEAALRLPLQNLATIERSGFKEVTMPCAACFSRHKTALHEIRQHADRRAAMNNALDYAYQDTVEVSTLIDALLAHVGVDAIADRVTRPLDGLRVVTYYGCLLTRPSEVTAAAHPENPVGLDQIMTALGAEVIDWSYKTVCCGAAHALTRPDIVVKLSGDLLKQARASGADLVVVACPLCHMNLDARQFQMALEDPIPVLYFTQAMAVAFDLPEKAAALHKNLVDPLPVLAGHSATGVYQAGPRSDTRSRGHDES